MNADLHWLGHASFRWDGSKTVYFDPWKLPKGSKKADIICISHEHFDHFSKKDIALIASPRTAVVTCDAVARDIDPKKTGCGVVKALRAGETFASDGVEITAVPSYNIGKNFHTKASGKIGLVVKMDGVAVYHAGDTDLIPEMKSVKCDVALLPVAGTYTMTADEAASAAVAVGAKTAVPMHYGDIIGSRADAERFEGLLNGKVDVVLLKEEGGR
jgi:L-ascorbate metabolism protein UlaG (beta-lactamase superfamily)